MSIRTQEELVGMLRAGKVVARTLRETKKRLRAGMTTAQLDEIALTIFEQNGARSAPRLVYGIPATILISVNDEIVHGIPGDYVICPGDLVKVDVTAELNGYMADGAITVPIPPVSQLNRKLCNCSKAAFRKAIKVARAGRKINEIGRAVESEVQRNGFSVVRDLFGHGIGRTIHEDPNIPNFYNPRDNQRLTDGLVITIEPMISSGSGRVISATGGWTVKTADGSPSAHYEHTIVITRNLPILLTAA